MALHTAVAQVTFVDAIENNVGLNNHKIMFSANDIVF